jgi:hypothetical protein
MMVERAEGRSIHRHWLFEVKLDGYRAITVLDDPGKPHLWSRNDLALEAAFPAIARVVSKLKLRSTILDGDVVAVDETAILRFQLLRQFQMPIGRLTLLLYLRVPHATEPAFDFAGPCYQVALIIRKMRLQNGHSSASIGPWSGRYGLGSPTPAIPNKCCDG